MQVLLWFTEGGAENTGNNIFPPPPPSLLFVFLHKAQFIYSLHFLLDPIFISFQYERWQVQEIIVIVAGPEKKTEEYHPLERLK